MFAIDETIVGVNDQAELECLLNILLVAGYPVERPSFCWDYYSEMCVRVSNTGMGHDRRHYYQCRGYSIYALAFFKQMVGIKEASPAHPPCVCDLWTGCTCGAITPYRATFN